MSEAHEGGIGGIGLPEPLAPEEASPARDVVGEALAAMA